MSNTVYINMNTFEMFNDLKDTRIDGPMFECDEIIAPTIQALNKLGFKTQACCSGHICDFKGINSLVPNWRDYECFIIFTTPLEECEEKGFTVPQGFEILDPAEYYEDPSEYDWEFGIKKSFDPRENKLLQILEAAKDLYTWAMAMVYAKEKEHQAAVKLMKEITIEIMPSYDWRLAHSTSKVANQKYATLITWKDCNNEDAQASVQDYYDFLKDLRKLFFCNVGENLAKVYPKLKKHYEYSRMKYFIPPIQQRTLNVYFVEMIAASLEEAYGLLYDQYNDPCGPSVLYDDFYRYLDELIESVEKYIEENF